MSRIGSAESAVPEEVEVPEKAKPLTETFEYKLKRFAKESAPPLILGQVVAFIFIALVLTNWLDFSKLTKTTVEDVYNLQSRIGYALQYSTPGMIWLLSWLFTVMILRGFSPANDPTSGNDHIIQKSRNILNNSFEQFVFALVSQLILVQYLDAENTLKCIPALAFLFIVGRIAFWLGYPKYRLFGMSLNVVPLTTTMAYNCFKFLF